MASSFLLRRAAGLCALSLSAWAIGLPASTQSNVAVWATATSTHAQNGRVIVFRFAKDFRAGFARASLPERVILVWRYASSSGLPSAEDLAAMNRLEDALTPLADQAGLAVLALVSTGENLREWIYYAKSEQAFFKALNQQLERLPRFPIEIHAAPDPKWETYERFRSELRE